MAGFAAIFAGPGALQAVGINNPPAFYLWAHDNKFTSLLLLHFVTGQIETQLLSTGAFEVYIDDKLTWSKLETGRLPSAEEVKTLVQDVMGPRALFDIEQEEDDTSFDS